MFGIVQCPPITPGKYRTGGEERDLVVERHNLVVVNVASGDDRICVLIPIDAKCSAACCAIALSLAATNFTKLVSSSSILACLPRTGL